MLTIDNPNQMQNMFWESWKHYEWFTKQTFFEGSLMAELSPLPTMVHKVEAAVAPFGVSGQRFLFNLPITYH